MKRLTFIFLMLLSVQVKAGIPTFDATQIAQSIIQTAESLSQTANQVTAYKKQVQEWLIMVHNTEVLGDYKKILDAANLGQSAFDEILNEAHSLKAAINQMENTSDFLDQYDIASQYLECGADCQDEINLFRSWSGNSKKALDGTIDYMDTYYSTLEKRRKALQTAIDNASNANNGGTVSAIQAGNSLLTHMASSVQTLQEIQSVQAQQMAVYLQGVNAREAKDDEKFQKQTAREGYYVESEPVFFGPSIPTE